MTIRYLDRNGSLCVANIPDYTEFKIVKRESGEFFILANRTALAEPLDKDAADKCIDKIYEQLKAKETACDLVPIQKEE